MRNRRRCNVCSIDVPGASIAKHSRDKKLLENEKQNDMILTEWFFEEPVGRKSKKSTYS